MSETEQKPKAKRPVLKVAPARVLVDTDSWGVSIRVFAMPSCCVAKVELSEAQVRVLVGALRGALEQIERDAEQRRGVKA